MSVNSRQVLSAQKVLGQLPSSGSELRLKLCDITWLIYSFFVFFFNFETDLTVESCLELPM